MLNNLHEKDVGKVSQLNIMLETNIIFMHLNAVYFYTTENAFIDCQKLMNELISIQQLGSY